MDGFVKLLAVLAIIEAVSALVKWLGRQAAAARTPAPGAPPPDAPSDEAASPLPFPSSPLPDEAAELMRHLFGGLRAQLDEAATHARELQAEAQTLERRILHAQGPLQIVRTLLDNPVRSDLAAAITAIEDIKARLDVLPPAEALAWMERAGAVEAALSGVRRSELHLEVLDALAERRRHPVHGPLVGDADAIAHGLLQPILRHADAYGLDFPHQRPLCAPAEPGYESVWFDLLPAGHPVVFVPPDFAHSLQRWASLAHEVGHLLLRHIHGFAEECRAATGVHAPPDLPRVLGGRLVGSMEAAYSAWFDEMVCDAVATVMLGPAALRGLVHSFACPEDRASVTTARSEDGHVFAPHPPAHLRVAWSARLLRRMGYDIEARTLLTAWNITHGEPTEIQIPVQLGFEATLPAAVLIDGGAEVVEAWYAARYPSLAGFTVSDIPGFGMSPGLWARVRKHTGALLGGQPRHDQPRVLLAAGIEAQARHPGPPQRLAHAIGQAILGLESGERRLPDRHYAPHRGFADPATLGEARDALILREILYRHRRGPHRPPWPGRD